MSLPDNIVSALRRWHEEVDIIGLGEAHHVPTIMGCYSQLMMKDCFPQCRHIVVEFGVQKHQGLLDRYLAGESVPDEELACIWRDSPLQALWVYDCYRLFLHTIRELNLQRAPNQRLHVWLAEPWLAPSNAAERHQRPVGANTAMADTTQSRIIRQVERTHAFVSLIERLIAQEKGKIVLIFGMRHLARIPVNGRTTLAHELIRRGRSIRILWPEMPPRFYVKPPPITRLEWVHSGGDIHCREVAPWGGTACKVGQLCDAVIRIPGSYRASMCDHSLPVPSG